MPYELWIVYESHVRKIVIFWSRPQETKHIFKQSFCAYLSFKFIYTDHCQLPKLSVKGELPKQMFCLIQKESIWLHRKISAVAYLTVIKLVSSLHGGISALILLSFIWTVATTFTGTWAFTLVCASNPAWIMFVLIPITKVICLAMLKN